MYHAAKLITFLFALVLGALQVHAQKQVKLDDFRIVKSLKITDKISAGMQSKEFSFLSIQKDRLLSPAGSVFLRKNKMVVLVGEGSLSILDKDRNGAVDAGFVLVNTGRTAPDTAYYMLFCSCGSQISAREGDSCDLWPAENGTLACRGNCTGESAGSSCSFTSMHIYDDGRAPVIRSW